MAAMRTDGKQLGAAVHQQHLFVADVPDKLAVDEIGQRDALREIRAAGRSLFLRHCLFPWLSGRHAEKFLPQLLIVAEAAEHAAGDKVAVRLVHAARGHAVMRRFDDDADTAWLEYVVDRVSDLRGQPLLNLQPLGIDFDHPGELADTDHAAAGDVCHPRPPKDRGHVMLAMALEAELPRSTIIPS